MPYESGGRGDKSGNRYETKYFLFLLLELLGEKVDYLILEALGDDGQGADIWVGNTDGINGSLIYHVLLLINQRRIKWLRESRCSLQFLNRTALFLIITHRFGVLYQTNGSRMVRQ